MMINAARLMGVLLCLLCLPSLARSQEAPGKSRDAADLISFEVSQQRACASQKTCEIVFTPVPAGHRLTIERIAIAAEIISGSFVHAVVVAQPTGAILSSAHFSVVGRDALVLRTRPIRSYVDGGAYAAILTTDGFFSTIAPTAFVTISGHLLNCATNPCGSSPEEMVASHRAPVPGR
jgi:hypothetical protein